MTDKRLVIVHDDDPADEDWDRTICHWNLQDASAVDWDYQLSPTGKHIYTLKRWENSGETGTTNWSELSLLFLPLVVVGLF